MAYAKTTTVSIDKSMGEIKKIVTKAGAKSFATVEKGQMLMIIFEVRSMGIKMFLKYPQAPSANATAASIKTYEQLKRSKTRSLVLCLKAKVEAIESGIETFEEAFLPHIVLKNGDRVADKVIPALEQFNETPTALMLGL